jgi:hypothetical protein
LSDKQIIETQRALLDKYLKEYGSDTLIAWYYTQWRYDFRAT